MILILVQINGSIKIDESQFDKLKIYCQKKGVTRFRRVTTAQTLRKVMQENTHEEIVLVSNFPPNSSYPENGQSCRQNSDGISYWPADSYSQSTELYCSIFKLNKFRSINFVTGASIYAINDEYLIELNRDIKATVSRLRTWNKRDIPHKFLYARLIKESIQKVTKKMSTCQ